MTSVHHRVVIDVPRERVFAHVSDYRNVPDFMFGVTKFEPLSDKTSGLGAKFAGEMTIGPKSLKSTLEAVEWSDNEVIRFESVDGFTVSTTWRFADVDGGTEVQVEFGYQLPGGLAGRALAAVVEPFVGPAVKQTDAALTRQLTVRT